MSDKTLRVRNVILGAGRPKVCVPITGADEAEIAAAARAVAASPANMAEWRADFFTALCEPGSIERVLAALRSELGEKPLLFTIRTAAEGGKAVLDASEYRALNERAARAGADLVDVEVFARPLGEWGDVSVAAALQNMVRPDAAETIAAVQAAGANVVGSTHDFTRTPPVETILTALRTMQYLNIDVCKAALMPRQPIDVISLLAATRAMWDVYADRPLITMSMGRLGQLSRAAGELAGSSLTFGTLGAQSAPGQIPVERLMGYLNEFGIEFDEE